ncbi:MAG: monothiol glutaredoxin, Grx4 family, partial [Proteobacteria bacterium]|nr:monothiol glutaredoxin, Grx4 family [Pseudomonadota bacterium]
MVDEQTLATIESIVTSDPVVLFMKGTRSRPQCGFSAQTVEILDMLLIDYASVDVLADTSLREGIKEYGG